MTTVQMFGRSMKRGEDDDEDWDTWTSNSTASILVDGQKINDVFTAIRKQLEYLRKKQKAMDKSQQEILELVRDESRFQRKEEPKEEPEPVVQPPAEEEEENETDAGSVRSRLSSKFMRTSFANTNFASKDDIQALRAEMEALKQSNEANNAADAKIKSLEVWMQTELKEMNKKMDKLVIQINQLSLETVEQKNKLCSLESSIKTMMDKQEEDVSNRIQQVEIAQLDMKKDQELKLSSLKDIVSVQEIKSKQMELKINNTMHHTQDMQQYLDSLPEKYFEQIQNTLNDLQQDKASRIELESKADVGQVLTKVDQFTFEQLQAFSEELERRLISISTDANDRIVLLDGKLDRRSDRIVSWCLKQVRKDLKNLMANPNGEPDHGTDIGKVQIRCLVCDQVTTQARETDIVHSQQGGFMQTIKGYQKPPRSNSPPRDASPPRSANPNYGKITIQGPPGHPEAMEYTEDHAHPTTAPVSLASGHLSSGHAPIPATSPVHSNINITIPHTVQNSHSMPLLKILSKSHPDGTTVSANIQQQPKMINYYKDLDQKYANTFHPGTNGASTGGAFPGNKLSKNNNRPTSAPMKRSSSSAKLKPMNVGTNFNDD
jgi:hypothetical protein